MCCRLWLCRVWGRDCECLLCCSSFCLWCRGGLGAVGWVSDGQGSSSSITYTQTFHIFSCKQSFPTVTCRQTWFFFSDCMSRLRFSFGLSALVSVGVSGKDLGCSAVCRGLLISGLCLLCCTEGLRVTVVCFSSQLSMCRCSRGCWVCRILV